MCNCSTLLVLHISMCQYNTVMLLYCELCIDFSFLETKTPNRSMSCSLKLLQYRIVLQNFSIFTIYLYWSMCESKIIYYYDSNRFFVRGGHSTINVMMRSKSRMPIFFTEYSFSIIRCVIDEKSRRIIYLRNIVLVFNGWRWKFAMPYLFSEYLFIIYCSFTPCWW